MNPRANGLVERNVGLIKTGIRRMVAATSGAHWWEVLPDVLRGLRVLPAAATGLAPYVLVFKAQPTLPIAQALAVQEYPE